MGCLDLSEVLRFGSRPDQHVYRWALIVRLFLEAHWPFWVRMSELSCSVDIGMVCRAYRNRHTIYFGIPADAIFNAMFNPTSRALSVHSASGDFNPPSVSIVKTQSRRP